MIWKMLSNDASHVSLALILFLLSLDHNSSYVMVLYQYFANFVCKIKALRALIFLSLIIAKSTRGSDFAMDQDLAVF